MDRDVNWLHTIFDGFPDPHADIKQKWYEANINLARTQKIKRDWFENNMRLAREAQKNKDK